jgi:hypothetical protein
MKERPTSPVEKYDAVLNSVNYQAQEAILDPNLPDAFKDKIVGLAIDTIQKVAEKRAAYNAKYGEGRRSRRPR